VDITTETIGGFLDSLGAKTPTPGGGAVSSIAGALGAALASMVVAYSIGKKSLAEHDDALRAAATRLQERRADFLRLAEEDARAYGRLNEIMRLPEDDPRRRDELPEAARDAAAAPLRTIEACADLAALLETLAPITNRHLRSDLAIAAVLTKATALASRWNVAVNAPLVIEQGGENPMERADALVAALGEATARTERACV